MIFHKTMAINVLTVLTGIVLFAACREDITEVPTRKLNTNVTVTDTSFITRSISRSTTVKGAEVTLQSVNYNLLYQGTTDETGTAFFEDIIPDFYNCTVQKNYPADTVAAYLPLTQEINLVGSMAVGRLAVPGDSLALLLKPVFTSPLVISEIYYNGSPPPPPYYFHDQFTEIYNNSNETVYLDGHAIGDVTYGYKDDDLEFLHCIHLYKFPGDGNDYPLYPGEATIIAQDAIDHTEINQNSLDLSWAPFEYYNHLSTDIDILTSTNMIQLHHKYGHDYLYSVFNDAIVLFKLTEADTAWTYDTFNQVLVPRDRAVDGVEYRESLHEYEYKHLPDEIDAGITGGMPAYKGKSVARKIFRRTGDRVILMDNNNSSTDFQVLDTPTPGQVE